MIVSGSPPFHGIDLDAWAECVVLGMRGPGVGAPAALQIDLGSLPAEHNRKLSFPLDEIEHAIQRALLRRDR